jgi:hypothetical protein
MSQWEYRIEFVDLYAVRHNPKPEIILMLNTLGAEGWEAVTSWGSGDKSYILYRPLEPGHAKRRPLQNPDLKREGHSFRFSSGMK